MQCDIAIAERERERERERFYDSELQVGSAVTARHVAHSRRVYESLALPAFDGESSYRNPSIPHGTGRSLVRLSRHVWRVSLSCLSRRLGDAGRAHSTAVGHEIVRVGRSHI